MSSFTLTPVEKGILRCQYTGAFSPDEIQTLTRFLRDYHGKLLVDLTDADVEECSRHLKNLRPMMPTAAVFGAAVDPAVLEIDPSYYAHDVRGFDSEADALAWLRDQ